MDGGATSVVPRTVHNGEPGAAGSETSVPGTDHLVWYPFDSARWMRWQIENLYQELSAGNQPTVCTTYEIPAQPSSFGST